MEMLFAEGARNKKIKYTSNIGEVPQHIFTDAMRIQQ